MSNPTADVKLEKSEGGNLRRVPVRSSDAVTFDPKIGFTLKLNRIDNPEGTYVCTARKDSFVRQVEYKVVSAYARYQSGK